jgi:hypothetical protein
VAAPAAPVTPTATEGAQPQGTSPEPISFEKHKATFMPQLEALYKIPEADIEGLRTNPEVYLPKLAAQLHYEVQLAAFNSVLTAMPDLVSMVMDQRTNVAEANTKFYDKWPALKQHIAANPQAEEAVRQSINAYRNANPKASQDDIITRAGLLAMVSLGIPLEQMLPQATAPAAPQAPVVRPTPHRPVGMGAVGHVPNHPAAGGSEGNIFERLAEAHMQGNI